MFQNVVASHEIDVVAVVAKRADNNPLKVAHVADELQKCWSLTIIKVIID